MAHSVIELTPPLQEHDSSRKYEIQEEGYEIETGKRVARGSDVSETGSSVALVGKVARDTRTSSSSPIALGGKAVRSFPAKLSKGCHAQQKQWIERVIVVLLIAIIWTLLAVMVASLILQEEVCCY